MHRRNFGRKKLSCERQRATSVVLSTGRTHLQTGVDDEGDASRADKRMRGVLSQARLGTKEHALVTFFLEVLE